MPDFSTAHFQAQFCEYHIQTMYLWSNGTLQVPLAAPNLQPSEMVQVSNPLGMKLVLWTVSRIGQPGQRTINPAPLAKAGEVLDCYQITPHAPLPMLGGNYSYKTTGIYSFFLTQPLSHDSGLLYMGQEAVDDGSSQPLSSSYFGLPAGAVVDLFSADHIADQYTLYETETTYVFKNGVVQQPTTNTWQETVSNPTCELIQAESPRGYRVVKWTAQRIGAFPTCPPPLPIASDEYLHYWKIIPEAPKLMIDQQYSYACSGEYWFHAQLPWLYSGQGLPMGLVGTDGMSEQDAISIDFEPNLLNPLAQGPGVAY